jgi:hypothetical protein
MGLSTFQGPRASMQPLLTGDSAYLDEVPVGGKATF